jgi:hypothetical protein
MEKYDIVEVIIDAFCGETLRIDITFFSLEAFASATSA